MATSKIKFNENINKVYITLIYFQNILQQKQSL